MNTRIVMAMIVAVLIMSSMGAMNMDGLKGSAVKSDRASISSATSIYYQQREAIPFIDKPLKSFKNVEVAKLYKTLAAKMTPAYVDANIFAVDISELKRAKALNKLVDSDRIWVSDKNNPTMMLTTGDEDDADLLASIDTGDKALSALTVKTYKSSAVGAVTAVASNGSNGVVLGGANSVVTLKWDSTKAVTEKNITSKFTGLTTPLYLIKPNQEIHVMDSTGKIIKGVDR